MTIIDARAAFSLSSLDAEVLLAHACKKDRSFVLAHPEYELTKQEEKIFATLAERRMQHEPVAYLTQEKEFFGRSFYVDHRVLIPRPSTEELITCVQDFLRSRRSRITELDMNIVAWIEQLRDDDIKTIVDVGTGSGCIAITLAHLYPQLHIIATDVSVDALDVAIKNAKQHHCSDRIEFRQGTILDPVINLQQPFLLVSNPPYIPTHETLMDDVQKFEPQTALFSGKQGTDVLEKMITQARAHPTCMGWVIECRSEQTKKV
jgi:release factor glutamine methyltransferase